MKKTKLFLLHFAGGNFYSYQFITNYLTVDFDVIPVELPGRGKRIKERLLTDFDLAARDILNQIKPRIESADFIIYGHSMGASLALRVSNLLLQLQIKPICVIVSGNPGPGIKENKKRYLLGKQLFIDELKRLGGFPKELIDHEELINFYEPILRADFEIAEKNNLELDQKINTPIYAMMGNKEEKFDEITNWSRFTSNDFGYKIFDGGHFFIHQYPEKIAIQIKLFYQNALLLYK